MLRMIVAGSRSGRLWPEDFHFLDCIVHHLGITELVNGGADGVDSFAVTWAQVRQFGAIRYFYADWDAYGKGAGPRRNKQMAEYAAEVPGSVCVLFPGGSGTQSMLDYATVSRLNIFNLSGKVPSDWALRRSGT